MSDASVAGGNGLDGQTEVNDPRLPDGGDVSVFRRALSARGWQVERCQGRVLRASRSRPILRYRVTYVDQGRELSVEKIVIGKAYYRGDGAGTFDFMRQLWVNGFADDPALTIPEPMAYVPELHLLLQAQAAGKPLYSHLDDPDAALDHVRVTGRWLAKLHGTAVGHAGSLPEDFEERKLSTYRDGLAAAVPGWAVGISGLTSAVLSALRALPERAPVPTHGDFQPKNIYVTKERATVIDWDRFALAHPARDVGHFLGQCMTMSYVRAGSFERIRSWNDAFMEEYTAGSPAALGAALPIYVVRTFLEILHYKLVVRPVADPAFVPVWLDECERLVAE